MSVPIPDRARAVHRMVRPQGPWAKHADVAADAVQVLDPGLLFARWLADGMVYPHTLVDGGLDAAPRALVDLLAGRHRGHVSLRVA